MSKAYQYKVDWLTYDTHIRILAEQIKKGGKKYTSIYTLSRGGLPIATHLSHLLKIPKIIVDIKPTMKGRILVVDDVSDTGKTLRDKILKYRSKKNTDIATLYRKDGTCIEPDFTVGTVNGWIIYPYEV